ncbi:MAG TPA: APC family permease [Gaiellaceae bacterium]|jgi:amino acid transporter
MSEVVETRDIPAERPAGLRRELKLFEAFALSIGIMAPTAAMALNGVAPAGLVGRAVPLAFLFASIAIALVSYAFIRLTRYFNHAGSAYALAGVTIGPRAGFFACWALLGTYSAFLAANFAEIGLFGQAFFGGIGLWDNPDWIILSLIAAVLLWVLAYNDIRLVTRSLLTLEALSVALIVILIVVIYVKVIGGSAPNGQGFTLKPFVPAEGTTVGAIAFASVFGLLSFGGFEAAASLGEETSNPRRNVPLAIAVAVGFTGVFYTLVMLGQTLGFGIDEAGTDAFASSSAPLDDLSKSFVGSGMADAINFGAMMSAFASGLGCALGASRLLFALGRDGFVSTRLGEASRRTGAPANALVVVMVFAIVVGVALRINDTSAVNAFFYMGTIGVLSMLVAYIVVNLGASWFLHFGRREAMWRIVIPILAIAALVYTIYKNVWPKPAYPYDLFPLIVGIWLAVGFAITLAFPRLTRRIGTNLAEAEGIRQEEPEPRAAPV